MRDVLVISGFWPTQSNPVAGIFVVQHVAALVRAGFRVTVVSPMTMRRSGAASSSLEEEAGLGNAQFRLVRLPILRVPEKLSRLPGALWLNTLLTGRRLRRCIGGELGATGFSGCIVHGPRYVGLSLPWWRSLIRGRTAVVVHGVDPLLSRASSRRQGRQILGRMAETTDAVVVVGRPLLGHVNELGIPRDRVTVIANGTDLPLRAHVSDLQRPLHGEPRIVVSVSNLVPLKGVDHNILALAELASRRPELRWEYRVIGDGPWRGHLEALTDQLGLGHRIIFAGRISYEATMGEVANADIFSLPSWAEAFGIVYLEAMARMKPVIGCLENGAADIITDGREGLLVPPHSVSALSRALERLIENPELSRRMGGEARLTAERFTWDQSARRILDLLGLAAPVR